MVMKHFHASVQVAGKGKHVRKVNTPDFINHLFFNLIIIKDRACTLLRFPSPGVGGGEIKESGDGEGNQSGKKRGKKE